MEPALESTPHPFRRDFIGSEDFFETVELSEPRQELGNLGFFTLSFVSWFIIIFGMIA